jgi:predicted nuclease of predicted toxin-antitoxin system
MKLLLDQNISRRILAALTESWPGSSQAGLLGLDCASDLEIWEYARAQGFGIVTKDADFEELSLLKGAPPKVIWLRLGNATNQEVQKVLLTNRVQLDDLIQRDGLDCIEVHHQQTG